MQSACITANDRRIVLLYIRSASGNVERTKRAMIETRIGICKVCWATCPIEVTVDNNRAIKVVGDRESPIYGGYTCPKGRAMPEGHYSPDRVLHAQRRRSDGQYEAIPTDQALDEIRSDEPTSDIPSLTRN